MKAEVSATSDTARVASAPVKTEVPSTSSTAQVASVALKTEVPAPSSATLVATAPVKSEETALASTSGSGGGAARTAALGLLRRILVSRGGAAEEAELWSNEVESAAWSSRDRAYEQQMLLGLRSGGPDQEEDCDADGQQAPMLRFYRAEIRRLAAAFKEPSVADGILAKLRNKTASPTDLLALPAEDLLPEAKRARLRELRTEGPQEEDSSGQKLPLFDELMVCPECGKSGCVRYCHVVTVKEGFAKAEIWGSRENEASERCKAQCGECFAEWPFDL